MPCRLVSVLLLATVMAAGGAEARAPIPAATMLADRDDLPTTGKERRKACEAEWRKLSASERTAKGPAWPQFYSRCVKRLKAGQA